MTEILTVKDLKESLGNQNCVMIVIQEDKDDKTFMIDTISLQKTGLKIISTQETSKEYATLGNSSLTMDYLEAQLNVFPDDTEIILQIQYDQYYKEYALFNEGSEFFMKKIKDTVFNYKS